jgi:FSR family fosmidomycin resistance protein-like MFS transporter
LQDFSDFEHTSRIEKTAEMRKSNIKGFVILSILLSLGSIINYGLLAFIPLFWVNIVGQSEAVAGMVVGFLTAIGAFSTYLGGKLSDSFGFRNIIILGFMLYSPSIWFASIARSAVLAAIAIIPLGLTINLSRSPGVALGQKYLPNNVGLSSGITLGATISFGGLASPFLGLIGDRYGLITVVIVMAVLSSVTALLSLLIPKEKAM